MYPSTLPLLWALVGGMDAGVSLLSTAEVMLWQRVPGNLPFWLPSYSFVISLPMHVSLILLMAEWPTTPAVSTWYDSLQPSPASPGPRSKADEGGREGGGSEAAATSHWWGSYSSWKHTLGLASYSLWDNECCAPWWKKQPSFFF